MRVLLLVLLVATVPLAGCTDDAPAPVATTTPMPPTDGGNMTAPPPQEVTDRGSIQGPFSRTWTLPVPVVSPRAVTVNFNLTGAQPGAPPTAQVRLELLDPEGGVVKTADAGVGASNTVAWTLGADEIVMTGDYTLQAVARSTGPANVPSGGLASYELWALVEY